MYIDWAARLANESTSTVPKILKKCIPATDLFATNYRREPCIDFSINYQHLKVKINRGLYPEHSTQPLHAFSIFFENNIDGQHVAILNKPPHFQLIIYIERQQTLSDILKAASNKLVVKPIVIEGKVVIGKFSYVELMEYKGKTVNIPAGGLKHIVKPTENLTIVIFLRFIQMGQREIFLDWIVHNVIHQNKHIVFNIVRKYPGAHILAAKYKDISKEEGMKLLSNEFEIDYKLSRLIFVYLCGLYEIYGYQRVDGQDIFNDLDHEFIQQHRILMMNENKQQNTNNNIKPFFDSL